MALDLDALKFAVDDARRRHAAVVELIMVSDRQAMGLLQLYVALAGAAGSAAATILYSASATFPPFVGWALVGFACPLAIGSFFCLKVMIGADIGLPGRKPDFWLWAHEEGVTSEEVYVTYLKELGPKEKQNTNLNYRLGNWLQWAKYCAAAAPLLLGAVAAAGWWTR
ncbi:hypothetical protein [Bradyrhizobium sp. HKCCYLR20261]|uniref:hypothetical protein n=1 Tax=Bradyrhizobium sp. HKCCYLR20261 TaxID=3420760 RepID=UPI003EB70D79